MTTFNHLKPDAQVHPTRNKLLHHLWPDGCSVPKHNYKFGVAAEFVEYRVILEQKERDIKRVCTCDMAAFQI